MQPSTKLTAPLPRCFDVRKSHLHVTLSCGVLREWQRRVTVLVNWRFLLRDRRVLSVNEDSVLSMAQREAEAETGPMCDAILACHGAEIRPLPVHQYPCGRRLR